MYGSKGVNTGAKIAEVRVSVRAVYLATLGVGIPTVFLLMGLADVLGGGKHDLGFWSLPLGLVLFLPLAAAHELLHGLAAVVHGRLHRRDVRIRVHWKAGVLACLVKVPIRVGTARVALIAPLAVTGPFALGLLAMYPCDTTAFLAGMTILGCSMDLAMFHKLRRFQADLLFVDDPTGPAFDIYAPGA
jgi:hypothetical protein